MAGDGVAQRTFTDKQGAYLAFIYAYTEINGMAPAETDMQRYFRTSPPTIHQMVKTLHAKGLIERTPRAPRTIKILLDPSELPILRRPCHG